MSNIPPCNLNIGGGGGGEGAGAPPPPPTPLSLVQQATPDVRGARTSCLIAVSVLF